MSHIINKELRYGALNYKPIMVNIARAKGIYMYDTNNKRYFDYLAGYSSVNQGHCNDEVAEIPAPDQPKYCERRVAI